MIRQWLRRVDFCDGDGDDDDVSRTYDILMWPYVDFYNLTQGTLSLLLFRTLSFDLLISTIQRLSIESIEHTTFLSNEAELNWTKQNKFIRWHILLLFELT